MFKKRESKGQLRKANDEDSDNEEEKSDDVEGEIGDISLIKARQNQRKKMKYDFSEIPMTDSKKSKVHRPSETSKSIQAMMGSQFAVKYEDSNKFNAHENIMEKYINEKLGLIDPTTGSEIIDNGANNKSSNSDDNEIGLLGVGCGLAEVELPMKYKLANIQETEIARQKMLDIRATKAMSTNIGKNNTMQSSSSSIEFTTKSIGGDFASFRYQKAYAIAFIPSGFGRSQDNKDKDKDTMSAKTSGRRTNEVSEPVALTHPTVPLPSNKTEVYTKSEYHSKSAGTRSDDYMVQQFKKYQVHRR